MVTRTLTTSAVKAKVYNPEVDQIEEKVIDLPGKVNEAEAEKIMNKKGTKVLKIVGIEYNTELTGMSDEEWIQYSHKLPARGKKAEG